MIASEARALLAKLDGERRRVILPFSLPGRNELDAARGRIRRVERVWFTAYDKIKKKAHADIILCSRQCHAPPPRSPVWVVTRWVERDRKRDPDNIVSGGRKLLLDALGPGRRGARGWVGAGLLHCDGWHCIAAFVDVFEVGAPRVEVVITEVQLGLPFPWSNREGAGVGRFELRADLRETAP